MYYYRLYGMLLESELCFPEADELTPPVTPDATLTLGMPPEWVVTEYRQGKFSSITERVMWFRLYDELLVYVEQGSKAIVCAYADLSSVRCHHFSPFTAWLSSNPWECAVPQG